MITLALALCLIAGGFPLSQETTAAKGHRTVFSKDVDGDRKPDKLVYEIKPWEKDYEGALIITSADGRTLWEHHWPIAKAALEELIDTEGGVTGKKVDLESWVAKFFSGELNYGGRFQQTKLKASELIAEDQLANTAKYHKVTTASIKESILSQKTNLTFSYRAEWREDLIMLVYVPSLRKFACYQRGY